MDGAIRTGWNPGELWIAYFALGGSLAQFEIEAYLAGIQDLPVLERDLLAHTLNEILEESGQGVRVPYSTDEEPATPAGDTGATAEEILARALTDLGAAGAVFLTAAEAEAQRLGSLERTGLVDSPAEERFDRITRQAREHFGVSSAIVALITDRRQYLKSVTGPVGQNLAREDSFCTETIRGAGTMVVNHTRTDERFRANPLVTGEPHLRFYAGYPLLGPGGWTVGTLCVLDQKPRGFSAQDEHDLRAFAGAAQQEITP
jgi:hypothetical protein